VVEVKISKCEFSSDGKHSKFRQARSSENGKEMPEILTSKPLALGATACSSNL